MHQLRVDGRRKVNDVDGSAAPCSDTHENPRSVVACVANVTLRPQIEIVRRGTHSDGTCRVRATRRRCTTGGVASDTPGRCLIRTTIHVLAAWARYVRFGSSRAVWEEIWRARWQWSSSRVSRSPAAGRDFGTTPHTAGTRRLNPHCHRPTSETSDGSGRVTPARR